MISFNKVGRLRVTKEITPPDINWRKTRETRIKEQHENFVKEVEILNEYFKNTN